VNPGAEIPNDALNNDSVDIVSLGQNWCDLQPDEYDENYFDWAYLNTQVDRASGHNKTVLLRIGTMGGSKFLGGATPNWVFSDMGLDYTKPNAGAGKSYAFYDQPPTKHIVCIPVFGHPVYLLKKTALIQALGTHFGGNPAVKIVTVSFANALSEDWNVPHRTTFPDGDFDRNEYHRWKDSTAIGGAGYTTAKMKNAAINNIGVTGTGLIDVTMAAFPNSYVAMATGTMGVDLDSNTGDPDVTNFLARTVCDLASTKYPDRFIAQKNSISATSTVYPGGDQGLKLIGEISDAGRPIAGQALWKCYDDPTYQMNDGNNCDKDQPLACIPVNGNCYTSGCMMSDDDILRRAADHLNTYNGSGDTNRPRYFEIYAVDIANLSDPGEAVPYIHCLFQDGPNCD